MLTEINAQRGDTVAQLRETKAQTEKAHKRLVAAEKQAAKQQAVMASNEKAVKQQLAARSRAAPEPQRGHQVADRAAAAG